MQQPMSNFLTKSERSTLLARHRLERSKKISDRMRTILHLDDGWSYEQVAKALFLDSSTVRRYYATYRESGIEVLFEINYEGKPCILDEEQQEQLDIFIQTHTVLTAATAVDFVREHFKKNYTISAMIALLRRLGFTYKKPKLLPGKADPKKQEQFLEELQKLEKDLGEEDQIVYMDGVHPQHNSKPAYGWFKKGIEKILKSNSGRKRININGIINIKDLEVIVNVSDAVNAQSTISLLQSLEKRYPNAKRIIVICDNARYYKSRMVMDYLKESRIEIKFLPPYSPNLNLIERLWRFMNKKVRDNKYYEKFQEFKNEILDFFKNIFRYAEELSRILTKKFHIIRV